MEEAKYEYWFRPKNGVEAVDTLYRVKDIIVFLSDSLQVKEYGESLSLSPEGSEGLYYIFAFINDTMHDSLELIDIKEIKEV
jgi:hypothetical protein